MKKKVFLIAFLFFFSIFQNIQAVEETDVVDISEFPDNLAEALNIPAFAGNLLASAILMALFLFPTMLLTHKKTSQELPIIFVGILTMSICIALGWTPYFLLLLICLLLALAYADRFRKLISGK